MQNQISDETRQHLNFNVRPVIPGQGMKEREVTSKEEEREDYQEIPPTTPSVYICDMCGKDFQNQNDLGQHKRFEREPGYSRSSTESA